VLVKRETGMKQNKREKQENKSKNKSRRRKSKSRNNFLKNSKKREEDILR